MTVFFCYFFAIENICEVWELLNRNDLLSISNRAKLLIKYLVKFLEENLYKPSAVIKQTSAEKIDYRFPLKTLIAIAISFAIWIICDEFVGYGDIHFNSYVFERVSVQLFISLILIAALFFLAVLVISALLRLFVRSRTFGYLFSRTSWYAGLLVLDIIWAYIVSHIITTYYWCVMWLIE